MDLLTTTLLVLSGCATKTTTSDASGIFYSGKAEIFDKKKQKTETVRFYVAQQDSDYFRMDITAGLLGVPMGTLILQGSEAQFVNIIERKNYRSKDGARALEKILKTPMKPQHILALFGEKFPLSTPWQCREATPTSAKCETVELFLDWKKTEDGQRNLSLDTERSRIVMDYKVNPFRRVSYDWLKPAGFEEIWLSM